MMANKIKFKKYIIYTLMISIILISLFVILNMYEYQIYTQNFNNKIMALVTKIKEKTDISQNEIVEILNNEDVETNLLEKYGIDISKDSIILKNEKNYNMFLKINIAFLVISFLILIFVFLQYNKRKDKEIAEITKYIEEINKKNYTLKIDEISEDELSILKNEIYKTTVMLKESAENSIKDKKQIKKSLEDISHQLKSPLTSILVMLDNLIDEPDMNIETREEFIRDIKREIVNINFLVQALLKLTKFDSNTMKFIKEKTYIKDIVDGAVKNVSTLCDLRNIEVEVNGDENAWIKCDCKWQIEAVTNIIRNCIDHSNEKSKIIINYEKNNVYVSISIKDFGEGISKKDLPHIFERFYKGQNATPDSIGIGLALSKTIIEEDNGTVSVESEQGKGSNFIIKYYL